MASGSLDTGQAGKKVWLVKVPTFVAKQWRAAAAASMAGGEAPELGRIRFSHDATQNASHFELQLADQGGTAPREFNVRVQTEDMQGMHSFAESRERGVSVTGVIEQRFDAEVKQGQGQVDAQYRAMNRQRNAEASTKTRLMKIIDDPRSMLALRPGSQVVKRRADKPVDLKRARLEKDVLEAMLFRLFERQSTWNFGQLQRETDQPAVWLKEVLSNVAVLNKAGPNKDLWEVKKEFKHSHVVTPPKMEPEVGAIPPQLRKVSVSGGSKSPRRVFGFEPSSGGSSGGSSSSRDSTVPTSPGFLTEALRSESSRPHSIRTGQAALNRRSFSFPDLSLSMLSEISGSTGSTAPIAVPTSRSTTPKRISGSQTFFDTAFTAGGDIAPALPIVYAPAAAPVHGLSPDPRAAIPLGHQAPSQLPPLGLQPPAALLAASWQNVRLPAPGIMQLPTAALTAPWQMVSPAAGACAPQNSLHAELLAVRAVAATASAQLHGYQAQLAQEHALMAQLAHQLAAVQAERDRLAEQVAVLRAAPDAPLAGDAQSALVFDLEVPPPPLPPPLPLRALRRPGPAALDREAKRVAAEAAGTTTGGAAGTDPLPAAPAQRQGPLGFANLDLPQQFAKLNLPDHESISHQRRRSSGSSMSPPEVPPQRCAEPRIQMLRADSFSGRLSDSLSSQWVPAGL